MEDRQTWKSKTIFSPHPAFRTTEKRGQHISISETFSFFSEFESTSYFLDVQMWICEKNK